MMVLTVPFKTSFYWTEVWRL